MANIIDSLIVELGLDPTNFDKGTKDAAGAMLRLGKTTDAEAKRISESGRKAASFFTELRNQALLWTSVALGGTGIKEFVDQTTKAGLASKNLAANIGVNATQLSKWQNMAAFVGASAEDVTGAFTGLYKSIEDFKLKGDASEAVKMFSQFGISLGTIGPDGVVHARDMFDIMKDIGDLFKNHRQDAMALGNYMGITPNMVTLLARGREALNEMERAQESLYFETERDRLADERWIQTRERLYQRMRSGAKNLLTSAIDTSGLPKDDKEAAKFMAEVDRIATTGTGAKIGDFLGASVAVLLGAMGNKEALHAFRMNQFGKDDGYREPATGGGAQPRSVRNNNPGNIEFGPFARSMGATGSDGRFAVFPDAASGRAAQMELLSRYYAGGNDTVAGIVGTWSPAKENGAFTTDSYIRAGSTRLGVDPGQHLAAGQLSSLADAMASHESGAAGGHTEINIENLTLTTSASNMKSLGSELANTRNYGLAAQANTGKN